MQAARSKYFARPATGFDENAVKTWIYPSNFPIRDYQLNICKKCLFTNTLVILPTGLGKTFIAAVVMMNFYRWYPRGKVIFMAPTKPLVAQQIQACVTIVAIPKNDSVQMTGAVNPEERKRYWKEKRVYFLTPQVLVNDMNTRACDPTEVKCLIVDEAHKAMGNSAYSQAVKELSEHNDQFRIIGLTATPGKDCATMQQILDNLHISHIEMRCEQSIDIQQYTHARNIEKIVVPHCKEQQTVKNLFLPILQTVVDRLQSMKVLSCHNLDSLTRYSVLLKQDDFRAKHRDNSDPRMKYIDRDFATCVSLCHAKELLQHGVRSFHNYMQEIFKGQKGTAATKSELLKHQDFMEFLEQLTERFNNAQEVDQGKEIHFMQIQQTQMPGPSQIKPLNIIGNPKLLKLVEVVQEHFKQFQKNGGKSSQTRVMIFSQFRDIVQEITRALNCYQPLIRATSFVGQQTGGSSIKGQNQKEQMLVMKAFVRGECNTLVATCIGEEGLDIGEVDLIVCYDAIRSPVRLVQRMGRTGRKRNGRIVCLVTAGREENVFKKSMTIQGSISKAFPRWMTQCRFFEHSHRMIPKEIEPVCEHRYLTQITLETKCGTKKSTIRNYLKKDESPYLDESQAKAWHKQLRVKNGNLKCLPRPAMVVLGENASHPDDNHFNLADWRLWQTTEQTTFQVGHSSVSENFVQIMSSIERQEGMEDSDSYGADLAPFLRMDDVQQHGEVENIRKSSLYDYFQRDTIAMEGPSVTKPPVTTKRPIVVDLSDDDDFSNCPKSNSTSPHNGQLQDEAHKMSPIDRNDGNAEVFDTVNDTVEDFNTSDSPTSAFAQLFILGAKAFKDVCEWKGFAMRDSMDDFGDCDEIEDSDEEEFFSDYVSKHSSALVKKDNCELVNPKKAQNNSMGPASKMENDDISNEYVDLICENSHEDLLVTSPSFDYFSNDDEDKEVLWLSQEVNFINENKFKRQDDEYVDLKGHSPKTECLHASTPKSNKISMTDADFWDDDDDHNEILAKHADEIEAQILGKTSNLNRTRSKNIIMESPNIIMPKMSDCVQRKRSHLNKHFATNESKNRVCQTTTGFSTLNTLQNCQQEPQNEAFKLEITLDDIDSGSSLISASPSPPRKKFMFSAQTEKQNDVLSMQSMRTDGSKVEDMELVIDDEVIGSDEDFKPVVKSYARPATSVLQSSTSYFVQTAQKHTADKGSCSSKPLAVEFIDFEAIDSSCDKLNGSPDMDDSKMDVYDMSFVDERTQVSQEDMTAVYLQSVRSPLRPKGLKLAAAKSPLAMNIYSQVDREMEDDDYMNDSFCVGSDDETGTRKFQRILVHSSSDDEARPDLNVVNNSREVQHVNVPKSTGESSSSAWITRPSIKKK